MDEIECPYCNANCGEPEEPVSSEDNMEWSCDECKKNFTFSASHYVSYYSKKAPCLNDGEHKYTKIIGHPPELFEGRYICLYCDKEEKRDG